MASQVTGVIEQIKIGAGSNQAIAPTVYGYCTTDTDQASKTVEMTGFKLINGVTIFIKFMNSNTAINPTLNIQNTGAKAIILYNGSGAGITPETSWYPNSTVVCTYDEDADCWALNNGIGQDTKIEIIRL